MKQRRSLAFAPFRCKPSAWRLPGNAESNCCGFQQQRNQCNTLKKSILPVQPFLSSDKVNVCEVYNNGVW